jgi:exodeoxyribonuclease V alpha subunit
MSPTRRAAAGTVALNAALQAALNPPAPDKAELAFGKTVFREGDRVMQTRNNYDLLWRQEGGDNAGMGVYNGDVGVVTLVDVRSKTLTVRFEDRLVDYAYDQLVELETAFAMTVHKSQGSEYDAVVLAALPCPRPLMTRRVLYTAVTRAKSLLVIVGDEQVLRDMCADARKRDRYSGLAERLTKQLTVS